MATAARALTMRVDEVDIGEDAVTVAVSVLDDKDGVVDRLKLRLDHATVRGRKTEDVLEHLAQLVRNRVPPPQDGSLKDLEGLMVPLYEANGRAR